MREWQDIVRLAGDARPVSPDLSHQDLKAVTAQLRDRHARGEGSDQLMSTALVGFAEAVRRSGGDPPDEGNLRTGLGLHAGYGVSVDPGEDTSLSLALGAFLLAVSGSHVHIVTPGEDQARHRAKRLRPIFEVLGVDQGVVTDHLQREERCRCYSDNAVIVGGYEQFITDYLRNALARTPQECCHIGRHVAVIDEVDSILIDHGSEVRNLERGRTPGFVTARIPVRDYFSLYGTVVGLSSVVCHVEDELRRIYGLRVVGTGSGEPGRRAGANAVVYRSAVDRDSAVVREVLDCQRRGRPVVIGAWSPGGGASIVEMLDRGGVSYDLLSPDHRERAEAVMEECGSPGTVTVIVDAAGRGYSTATSTAGVRDAGGIRVLGVGRSASARADEWLAGLAVRGDDAGESTVFLSMEDPGAPPQAVSARRVFRSRVPTVEDGMRAPAEILDAMDRTRREREDVQSVERLRLWRFDEVEQAQWRSRLEKRHEILHSSDPRSMVMRLMESVAGYLIESHEDATQLVRAMEELYSPRVTAENLADQAGGGDPSIGREHRVELVVDDLKAAYARREREVGGAAMREMERRVLLQVMDGAWEGHMAWLDDLRSELSFTSPGSDALSEYRRRADRRLGDMERGVSQDVLGYLFNLEV